MLHSTSRLSLASSHFQPLLVCVFVSSVCVCVCDREREGECFVLELTVKPCTLTLCLSRVRCGIVNTNTSKGCLPLYLPDDS